MRRFDASPDIFPAHKAWIESQEVSYDAAGCAVEDLDARSAAWPGAGDDVGMAIGSQVHRGHTHPAKEAQVVRKEIPEQQSILAAEHPHFRAATHAGSGDDINTAIAVDVAGAAVDAAREAGGLG